MARLPKFLRFLLLASAMPSTISASPAGGPMYIQDTTCSASGLQACPAGLPNNFCCSKGSTCLALAGNTTALCCPQGQTCDKIQPITCDIRQQDPDQNANVPIKTSIFNVELEKCGTNLCCPFGYSCSDGQCLKKADQSQSPRGSSSTSSATTSAQPTATTTSSPSGESTASTTSSAAAADSATEAPDSQSSKPKTLSIVGGVVGGCAVLILFGVIAFLFVRRNRRRRQDNNVEKASITRIKGNGPGPYGNIISDPIIQPNSYRTDFILKSPSASSSISQRPPQITHTHSDRPPRLSIPNPFDSPNPSAHSPTHSRGSVSSNDDRNARTGQVGTRLAPIRAMKASSTRVVPQNVQREPSSESINVFADPVTVSTHVDKRQTHATTFTDLMYEADLGDVRRGKPYVPGTTPRI